MSLIFDTFPSFEDAERFARAVKAQYPELEAVVFADAALAQSHDPTPYEQVAPIVHVERPSSDDDDAIAKARELGMSGNVLTAAETERAMEFAVEWFGGRFAGT